MEKFYIGEFSSTLVTYGVRSMTYNSYIKKAKVLSTGYSLHANFGDLKDNHLSE